MPTFIAQLTRDLREVTPLLELTASLFNKINTSLGGVAGTVEKLNEATDGETLPSQLTGPDLPFSGRVDEVKQLPPGITTVSARSSGGGGGGGGLPTPGDSGILNPQAAGFRNASRIVQGGDAGRKADRVPVDSLTALQSIDSEIKRLNDKVNGSDGGANLRSGGLV